MHFSLSALLTVGAALQAARASPLFRSTADPLQLLRHVMANERYWAPVLAERVKKLPKPPYQDSRFKDRLVPEQYVERADAELDVRHVVATVAGEFSDMRSMVNYGARTLHQALTCHAKRHLAFQTHYISLLLVKNGDASVVVLELSRLRENVAVVLDKLAVYQSDMGLVLDVYWEAVRLIQMNAVQQVRGTKYPRGAKDRMEELHRKLVGYMHDNCTPFMWDKWFFDQCAIGQVTDPKVYDAVLIADVRVNELVRVGHAHAKYMSLYFRNLGVSVLPRTQWGQIFYYTKKLAVRDKLNYTNVRIVRRPVHVAIAPAPIAVGAN